MADGLITDIDCERKEWIVLRLCRLGDSSARYVLTIQKGPNSQDLRVIGVTVYRQLEGDPLIGGEELRIDSYA